MTGIVTKDTPADVGTAGHVSAKAIRRALERSNHVTTRRSTRLRTASIRLDVTGEQANRLSALRAASADACNRLVPIVREPRVWNRVALHRRAYTLLREHTPLGSQLCCNAIFSVCHAYKAQKALGRIRKDEPVPEIRFDRASVHCDQRTSRLRGETVSLTTLSGRILVPLRLGKHQRRLLESGAPKKAELVFRKERWSFNLVVESGEVKPVASGPVMGVDVGDLTLAAVSTGKVFGGEPLRDERDRDLALRRRLQSNGSHGANQKLRQVSGKEARRVRHLNHDTSKAMVEEAKRIGVAKIVLEDLTHLRDPDQGRHAPPASVRVCTLWSPGAQRRECESEPCPDGRDRRSAQGACQPA